jgi:hypothetical protein
MRKLFLFSALAALSVAVLGCPKKTDAGADAAAEAAAAAPADAAVEGAAAAAAPGDAKNAAEVARFPNETPIANETAVIAQVTNVHASPGGGKLVASLRIGITVTKIAEHEGSILITFISPADGASLLEGWVSKMAFTQVIVVVDAGHSTLECGTNQAKIKMGGTAVCKVKCTKDADCPKPKAGNCQNAKLDVGGVAKVCID